MSILRRIAVLERSSMKSEGWRSNGIVVMDATTSAPTKPSSMTTDTIMYNIIRSQTGDLAEIEMILQWAGAGGSAAGSGDYLFGMPAGLKIDGTKLAFYTPLEAGAGGFVSTNIVGFGIFNQAATALDTKVIAFDADNVRLFINAEASGSNGAIASSHAPFTTANQGYYLRFTVPIL